MKKILLALAIVPFALSLGACQTGSKNEQKAPNLDKKVEIKTEKRVMRKTEKKGCNNNNSCSKCLRRLRFKKL